MNKKYNIAILGGFGTAIGDTIQGISALKIVQDANEHYNFSIFKNKDNKTDWFYEKSLITYLNYNYFDFQNFDLVIDFRNIQKIKSFYSHSTFDFFIFSLNSLVEISDFKKRPFWLEHITIKKIKETQEKYCFLSTTSSQQSRTIPLDFTLKIIQFLKANYNGKIFLMSEYKSPLIISDPQIVNVTNKVLTSTENWASIIKYADFIITSDSGAYHFSEGLKTKAFVFFTNVKPENRIKNYIYSFGIDLNIKQKYSDYMETFNPSSLNGIEKLWNQAALEKFIHLYENTTLDF